MKVISSYLETLIVEIGINIKVNKVQWQANFDIRAVFGFTQRRMIVSYKRFVTFYRSHLQGTAWSLKMGPIGYPEISVRNYYPKLRKILKQFRPNLNRGRNLNTQMESFAVVDSQCSRNLISFSLAVFWTQNKYGIKKIWNLLYTFATGF